MASLRRSRVLSPEGQTAKFLYTIIKQLDLKAIDWNEVASGLDITNGHAARMRYSRFKAQIEGLPTQAKSRAPRPKKDNVATRGKGKNKPGYEPGKVDDMKFEEEDDEVKLECNEPTIKPDPGAMVKQEHFVDDMQVCLEASVSHFEIKPEPELADQDKYMHPSLSNYNPLEPVLPIPHNELIQMSSPMTIKQESLTELDDTFSPAHGLAVMNIQSSSAPTRNQVDNNLGFIPQTTRLRTPAFSIPSTPHMNFSLSPSTSALPPNSTVSLAELQLPSIPRSSGQMPLPTSSYPIMPMSCDFDFDFNAPIPQSSFQMSAPWQPQFDMFQPVQVKREVNR